MTSRFMGAAGNGVGALPMVDDVRSLPSLSPRRQCRHAVIVCVDDPAAYEAARDVFADLRAELVVESEPGPFCERSADHPSRLPTGLAQSASDLLRLRSPASCRSSRASSSLVRSAARRRGVIQAGDPP
jgi:hypothetical protein